MDSFGEHPKESKNGHFCVNFGLILAVFQTPVIRF